MLLSVIRILLMTLWKDRDSTVTSASWATDVQWQRRIRYLHAHHAGKYHQHQQRRRQKTNPHQCITVFFFLLLAPFVVRTYIQHFKQYLQEIRMTLPHLKQTCRDALDSTVDICGYSMFLCFFCPLNCVSQRPEGLTLSKVLLSSSANGYPVKDRKELSWYNTIGPPGRGSS